MKNKHEQDIELKNAELEKQLATKNRDLEIEAALERVRSRTMAMQSSEELAKTVSVLFKELLGLGIKPGQIRTCGIVTFNTLEPVGEQWITETNGEIIPQSFIVPYNEAPAYKAIYEAWKNGEKFKVIHLEGEPLKQHLGYLAKYTKVPVRDVVTPQQAKEIYNHVLYFSQGCLFIITKEALPEYHEVFKRFGAVFQQSYTRFLDLKKSEAQAREAQIELALERVRARTMAMYHSEELAETAVVLFEQLSELGNEPARIAIWILDQEKDFVNFWATDQDGDQININFKSRISEQTTISKMYAGWKEKIKSLSIDLQGKELAAWVSFCREEMGIIMRDDLLKKRRVHTVGYFSQGWINYTTHDPLSADTIKILERFSAVFDQAYVRFLDLQKAEAQAREAEVQLALERVRARTMAMQHSNELSETAYVLYQQFASLGNKPLQITIGTIDAKKHTIEFWGTDLEGHKTEKTATGSLDEPFLLSKLYAAWKNKKKSAMFALSGGELKGWIKYREQISGLTGPELQGTRYVYLGYFSTGAISISTEEPLPEETVQILERFAAVFDGTYTRFLDLQKAEAQAREAQIEASLERVRSRTMGMQKSEELAEVIQLVYDQLCQLNFNIDNANFVVNYKESDDLDLWLAVDGQRYSTKMHIPYLDHPIFNRLNEAKVKGLSFFSDSLTFEEKNTFFRHFFENAPQVPQERKEAVFKSAGYTRSVVFMKTIALSIQNYAAIPYSDAENAVLVRFGKVFEQTYTRFNDLKQAEEQAREAKIEAGLERVRAKAMAMHSSENLAETIGVFYYELGLLSVTPMRCGLGLMEKGVRYCDISTMNTTEQGKSVEVIGRLKMAGHRVLDGIYDNWLLQKEYHPVLRGNEIREYYQLVRPQISYPDYPNSVVQYGYFFYFRDGGAFAWTDTELPEDELQIYRRFTSVLSLTYRRYKDITEAETQAKESQIQLALERVRARTMAMQKSEELAETATVLFQQLLNLGISSERTFIGIPNDDTRKIELWGTEQGGHQMSTRFEYEADATYAFSEIYKAWQEKKNELTVILKGKKLEEHVNYVRNILHMPLLVGLVQKQRILYNAFFSKGLLMIVTPDTQSQETLDILQRFAGVFDGTYTRFLDLQRAEDQAREAQVEAALERVRSKTMAMHNSEDVGGTVAVMFNELIKLGVEKTARCGIAILDEVRMMELWTARLSENEKADLVIGHIDMHIHPMLTAIYDAWKNKESSFSYELAGDDLSAYITAINNYPGYPVRYDISLLGSKQFHSDFFFPEGMLFVFTSHPFDEAISSIFKRFAGVFGQTYRRYLDLQKAEAAAREAQIEAALERVRSKTMAMHNSQDVGDTVGVMFHEFVKLGIEKMIRCGIGIMSHENRTMELWTAKWGENEKVNLLIGHLDMTIHKMLGSIYDAWESKQSDFTYHLAGSDLVSYAKVINSYPDYPLKYDLNSLPPAQFFNDFYFNEGVVFAFTSNSLSDEIVTVLKRFAGVFGQTYRRYLDLQKAENQAREAQIEAALERVRSKAMAMRSSNDLNATANTVFIELRKLGIDLVRCGLGLMEKESHISTIHAATNSAEGGSLEVLGNIDMNIHPVLEGIYNQWRQNKDYFPVLEEESLRTYYEKLHESGISVPEWKSGEKQYGYFLPFAYGSLYAWSGKQESEITIKTLKRFTSVIGLTYTRYIELQKAESNTKEAIKQASLDRVRAEIASMRKRSDLERITPLIWDELTILGIPFIRCGVFIMDEEQKLIHTFLSTPDGKAIGAFHVPFDTSGNFEKMVDSWRHKEPYIDHWKEEAFSQFADALVKQRAISSKAQYMRTLPHEGVHLNFLPFLQGMLYVGNIEPLAEDNIDLIQAVADAFSTAYARYEDFNKLEAAKQQVDNTLIDLKAAQTKLIQSEKMASLGELTAGIAHEIQNPLNFVNNFSEVNQEMIDELQEELKAGNIEEALAIAADIKQNEEKISHHGKRADGIVKGMLQHSRTGGGEKQLTNMNVLADEFLRLSYHGLRAKDKTFNAEMVTHFDPDLPKISVIAQDMGRVLLNLFNNAFYAVNQKKKTASPDYRPEVSVSTSVENGQVIIKVKDNGIGMPEHVKEKIMQPFFTTKPTGEGTGLGLSLTYDMVVKGHGGSIAVASKEGEGAEFTILLPIN